ncbi:multicomponent Na+:H+ antiporter subunit F [Tessaracoccus bendigoensis DSM 12906]|uniref:Multicomponent Na+:H+ antiporter subunit F n=1 Tax=Tessaracoccus bendigoensis DSM 12906 TaxID=1123357 RepID=A0A1M6GKL0_9ACTN|nr:monovalent cation/H+ antiporter complex subunit F [Tessaracoccus bendigoensis]SHJ10426.1 multicomponent Na+:H+ antiporter subunit F [Tessaracoccus bendigoensis DSM 12906]
MTLATEIVLSIAAVLLFASAMIGVNRIAAGPSQLDRSIAADLIVAIVVAVVGLWTVWSDLSTQLMILVLLSMLGFTSAVSIARMLSDRYATRRRFPPTKRPDGES